MGYGSPEGDLGYQQDAESSGCQRWMRREPKADPSERARVAVERPSHALGNALQVIAMLCNVLDRGKGPLYRWEMV